MSGANLKPESEPEMPPASMTTLLTMLASQALVALGKIPDPIQKKPVLRPKLARHFIDMIALLQNRTQGNLSTDEAQAMESLLHDLRVTYVEATGG